MRPAPAPLSRTPMSLYSFDGYQLDPRSRRLTREGSEVGVEPRVFDVIVYLIEQRKRAVGRDELIAAAWGRIDSSDATLAQAILKARRLFGDDGSAQRVIRTVARFGYQWVAATDAIEAPVIVEPTVAAGAGNDSIDDADFRPARALDHIERARTKSWTAGGLRWLAAALALFAAASGVRWFAYEHRAASSLAVAQRDTASVVPGLIVVAPARVHSAVAQDGWMRLGVMAMGADALRSLPGHAVVPNETVLAAVGAGGNDADETRLRAATGAAIVVAIDARHDADRWLLDATVTMADGTRQSVNAEAGDAVVAAGAMADRLRSVFGGPDRGESAAAPNVLAVAARMQAAILEGHADRAVALSEAADVAAAPEIILLRAKAMNRLGRAADAISALQSLIARSGQNAPAWLATAWTTLGYSALVVGQPDQATQQFRKALALVGTDRIEAGRAWRGLGNAQAALGDFDDAEASYLRARLELEGSSDRLLLTHILDDLGSIAGRRGRLGEAIERYRASAASAAALGATEIELGARMNIALAQQEMLQHAAALATWSEVLPRVRALAYPAMRRYATVHYADALAETGAFAQAADELDRMMGAPEVAGVHDALEDVRLDLLRTRLAIGDARTTAAEARMLRTASGNADGNLVASALLLQADLAEHDEDDARAVAASLPDADFAADPSARVQALLAFAQWQARSGDPPRADTAWRDALALVRVKGSPRELRDVALPYAAFELARGHDDAARMLAGLVDPYADDDFAITLLRARIAAAGHDAALAGRLYARAHALAGERWTPAIAGEETAAAAAPAQTLVDSSVPHS
jgi:DNA-binding winged helix-turn-helix (wHTH) protein/tetratricopeptide (TPR) repeat protein